MKATCSYYTPPKGNEEEGLLLNGQGDLPVARYLLVVKRGLLF
jgi:hypothetical protein